jgi:hypothetical protein
MVGQMFWRGFVVGLIWVTFLPMFSTAQEVRNLGWVSNKEATEDFIRENRKPYITQWNADISTDGEGKCVLLYKAYEEVVGAKMYPEFQETGDCVAVSCATAVDLLVCTRIAIEKKQEKWPGKCVSEIIYGGSRRLTGEISPFTAGSTGAWAAEFITKYGTLVRKPYGPYDFSRYSGQRAILFGALGIPESLQLRCREHPVKTASLVTSWEQVRGAVANGYPVLLCSSVGFNTKRDSEGFLRPWSTWNHAMVIIGVDDKHKRPGALVMNSWGINWIEGPTRHDQPVGSFWVDAKVIDAMVKQEDSFAISGFIGYPKQVVPDYILY